MIVRLLRPWKTRRVGTVFSDMPDGVGNMLVKRGIGEQVKPVVKVDKEPEPEVKWEKPKRVR